MIGCKCAVCTSSSSFNQRLRPSGLLEIEGKKILIDAGPDLRLQALRCGLSHLDGLILTHTHFDHIAGIDELRVFSLKQKQDLPCLLSQESFQELASRYAYLLQVPKETKSVSARFAFHLLEGLQGELNFLGIRIGFVSYAQGTTPVTGFRFGEFAYLSDIKEFDVSILEPLRGVRFLCLSALCKDPSKFHLSFEEAAALGKKIGAEKTFLTHMNHEVDHEYVSRTLPPGVFLAYDGLEIAFES